MSISITKVILYLKCQLNSHRLQQIWIFCSIMKKSASEAHGMLLNTCGEATRWVSNFNTSTSAIFASKIDKMVGQPEFSKIQNQSPYLMTSDKIKTNRKRRWEGLKNHFQNYLKVYKWFRSKEIGCRMSQIYRHWMALLSCQHLLEKTTVIAASQSDSKRWKCCPAFTSTAKQNIVTIVFFCSTRNRARNLA